MHVSYMYDYKYMYISWPLVVCVDTGRLAATHPIHKIGSNLHCVVGPSCTACLQVVCSKLAINTCEIQRCHICCIDCASSSGGMVVVKGT